MPWTVKTKRGEDPSAAIIRLKRAAKPSEADLLYAGQRQRTRILDRTTSGVDVNGSAFAPYSTKGPFYYYPTGRVGSRGFTVRQQKAAVRRLLKITGEVSGYRSEYLGSQSVGGVATRSGLGIRFESYADFKASLGRAGVDLTGPRAPHMLQAIIVKAERPDELRLGIYGDAANRAEGNNLGTRTSPARRFFGASPADIREMVKDVYARIAARLGGKET